MSRRNRSLARRIRRRRTTTTALSHYDEETHALTCNAMLARLSMAPLSEFNATLGIGDAPLTAMRWFVYFIVSVIFGFVVALFSVAISLQFETLAIFGEAWKSLTLLLFVAPSCALLIASKIRRPLDSLIETQDTSQMRGALLQCLSRIAPHSLDHQLCRLTLIPGRWWRIETTLKRDIKMNLRLVDDVDGEVFSLSVTSPDPNQRWDSILWPGESLPKIEIRRDTRSSTLEVEGVRLDGDGSESSLGVRLAELVGDVVGLAVGSEARPQPLPEGVPVAFEQGAPSQQEAPSESPLVARALLREPPPHLMPDSQSATSRARLLARVHWAGGAMSICLWLAYAASNNAAGMGAFLISMACYALCFLLTMFVARYPRLPKLSPVQVHASNSRTLKLTLNDNILSLEGTSSKLDIGVPFSVNLTRDPELALVGVELRQGKDKRPALRFRVPFSGAIEHMPALSLDAPVVDPEDFKAWIWPVIVYGASVHGQPLRWRLSD